MGLRKYICVFAWFSCLVAKGQSGILIETYERNNEPIRLAAHTDSALFFLIIKNYEKGKSDFYVSKRQAGKRNVSFDTSLQIAKLFDGKLDTKTFRYSAFQCNDHIIFVFDVYVGSHKKVIAKVINFNGNVSAPFVLDDSNISSEELLECNYFYELTDKKELLITLRRKYKSGFQRDKCILYNEYLEKLWDYEFPKINHYFNINLISTVYNSNQLVYQVKNGFLDKLGHEWIIKSDYDTIIKKSVEGLMYDLKVPKDSICLVVANPVQKTAARIKVYWPFKIMPHIQPISASQVLLYNLVNIDDEKFVLPAKKAIYYKRIDTKSGAELYENLTPLNKATQENLTYQCGPGSNGSTSKKFRLLIEQLISGKLYSVFENNCFEESELVVSCFDIPSNKFEWIQLLPRKISTSSNLSDLIVRHVDGKLDVSFYENKQNFEKPLNLYVHRKHKMVRNLDDSQFITFKFDENGAITKELTDPDNEAFLFPWLKPGTANSSPHFFKSSNFLPLKYFYKSQSY